MQILFSPEFQRQVLRLESADARLVGAALDRLQLSVQPLGKRLSGKLHDCYSIRVGLNQRLRIVYKSSVSNANVLVVGPREHGLVYIQALQVLNQLER